MSNIKKWEYKILPDIACVVNNFNKLGEKGWELVTIKVEERKYFNVPHYIFKRVKYDD